MTYFLIVAGFALLLFGGEAVVRAAVALSERLGISPLIVGVTVVGFGTSLPEMVVSVNAALVDSPGIAIGNVIGSNIANILLILGIAALISPIAVHPRAIMRDTNCMCLATVAFCAIGFTGALRWNHGIGMLGALFLYIGFTVWRDARANDAASAMHREEAEEIGSLALNTWGLAGVMATGLFAVIIGAEWLVDGATTLAKAAGVPEEVIGLTLIAVGTSLPELATSIVAAYRGHADVCIGNVLGSNIFNLFAIAGVTSFFATLPFSDKILGFDIWVLIAATALLIPFMLTGRRISRLEGFVLAACYVAYVSSQFLGMSGTVAKAA